MNPTATLVLQPHGSPGRLPEAVAMWLSERRGEAQPVSVARADDLLVRALRGRPPIIVLDARPAHEEIAARSQEPFEACRRLKLDSYTAVVPTVMIVGAQPGSAACALDAGADDAFDDALAATDVRARLDALVRRSRRDIGVHPTTRLPGTDAIEAELDRRIAVGAGFAAAYADLDHFKEYNDRYGYTEGDRVIRMLALVLHDVVKGVCGEAGFVGHIGGDDFFFVVPLDAASRVCGDVVETFDTLVPLQYSESDRRAGYYLGKDRRGRLHRVPLMSVSIGVVTTERRRFLRAGQVSSLASEMKSYAKSQPGSLCAVDRRHDDALDATRTEPPPPAASASRAASVDR